MSNAVVDSLTIGLILGATLRDVGAEHHADSWVCCETPGKFLTIWIPTVVLAQVSGKQKKSAGVGRSGGSVYAGGPLTCRSKPEV